MYFFISSFEWTLRTYIHKSQLTLYKHLKHDSNGVFSCLISYLFTRYMFRLCTLLGLCSFSYCFMYSIHFTMYSENRFGTTQKSTHLRLITTTKLSAKGDPCSVEMIFWVFVSYKLYGIQCIERGIQNKSIDNNNKKERTH